MKRQPITFRKLTAIAFLLAVAVGFALLLPGCGGSRDDGWPNDKAGPKVVVSFAPYYCFATNVAGDDAVVRDVLTTTGPHHFNPTDKDALMLRRADIFFVNGLGLEGDKPEAMKKGSGNKNLKIVELGARIPQDRLCEGSCHHGEEDGDHHDHEHGMDPHVWLSPDQVIILVEGIRDELKTLDPPHAANYDRRANEYVAKIRKLKEDGLALLKDKKDRRLVTFHDSMAYFAKTFNLEIVGVVEKTPGTEPNDKQLRTLIALCEDAKAPVRIVCVEPQYSASNAGRELVKILAQKHVPDPRLVELDPLETVPPDQLKPDWYETKMRANLEALARDMR
jgi:ABC-type Zn uptake system ZnuABC Zn-binding protein ZnuA